jgi:hypothetical protein
MLDTGASEQGDRTYVHQVPDVRAEAGLRRAVSFQITVLNVLAGQSTRTRVAGRSQARGRNSQFQRPRLGPIGRNAWPRVHLTWIFRQSFIRGCLHDLTRGTPGISHDSGSGMIWNLFDR